ncbi:MAG: hypothetical protein C0599_15025 [Salinivirgaceae bacterium]|nr:MAG: hypothetical protein C0599_15025 [Salinivirgaceae bacterium]
MKFLISRILPGIAVFLMYLVFVSCEKEDDNRTNYTFDYGSIVDIEGNTYRTIAIGTQEWMADNLKTATYNDGTPIYLEENPENWSENLIGAYCEYDENEDFENYGVLYNYYAVNTNKLCPDGWHVPSEEDWQTLELFLGMSQANIDITGFHGHNEGSMLAGGASLWQNDVLTNNQEFGSSGFNALPSGGCSIDGIIDNLGNFCSWWSTSPYLYDSTKTWYRGLLYDESRILRSGSPKYLGRSVRCVKN